MRRCALVLCLAAFVAVAGMPPAGASTPTSVSIGATATGGGAPTYGSGVTLFGSVTAGVGTPTGSVSFAEGQTALGSGMLTDAGSYEVAISALSAGTHTITASYAGTATFAPSQKTADVVIGKADTIVSVAGPDFVFIGHTADYTVTVSRIPAAVQPVSGPTGTVTVHGPGQSAPVYGTIPLTGGVGHISVPASAAPNAVYFDYSGDANYNPGSTPKSLSGPNKYGLTMTLTDAHGCTPTQQPQQCVTPVPGYPMLLAAILSPVSGFPDPPDGMEPTGSITFGDMTTGTQLGTATIVHGVAAIFAAFDTPGPHAVQASYNGDANFTFTNSGGTLPVSVIDADQIQRYVNWVYLDLLGRDGDQGGIAYWSTLLETGTSRAATSWALVNSNEYRANTIADMYEQFLERDTDPSGLNYWVGQVGAGMTFEQFQSILIGSDEYYAKASKGNGNDTSFVRSMYQDVLGRPVDQGGLNYFLGLLAHGTSRAQVVGGIVYSTEHLSTTVDGYYLSYLGRHSEPDGQQYWTAQLQRGARDELIIALIIGSDEYFSST